jgi:hypothetical protein
VAGTFALGALLTALLIAWLTGAFRNTSHHGNVWLAIALFVGGNLALVLNENDVFGALGVAAMVAAVVALVRLRPRTNT